MWPVLLIYLGTCCYTLAAYYHLQLQEWSFFKALLIAIPLVLIEYTFSLHGNFYAYHNMHLSAITILIVTMCFYFINLWLLNYFVLHHKTVFWKELLAFAFILCAFALSGVFQK
jgi:hypothetical protein